jgi:hypothetical protein
VCHELSIGGTGILYLRSSKRCACRTVCLEEITSRFALALRIRLNPGSVQANCTVGQDRKMINMALDHMSDDYLIF